MDAYLSEVDFQSLLSQSYPPEPDVQDACYAQLLKCVNDHRAALGGVNPDALLDFLLKEACGLGAIDTLIDDEEVTDFTVYSFETIVAERNGRREISELQFTSADVLYLAAQRLLAIQGLNAQTAPAFTEGRLGDGTQIEIVLPPVSVSSTYIVVRKTCRRFNSLSALVHSETLSSEMAKFLLLCVKARRNILVVGPQGSGRTSILNALGSEIPDGERIVTVENSAMMLVPQLYVMSLEAQNASYGQGSELAALIRYASKLRAERVLVDTVQTPSDARAFLSAICAGAQGSMATMSGLTAGDGFQMLGYLAEADNALSKASSILGVIDIVIATRAFTDAKRRIVEISEVVVLEDGSQGLIPLFEWVDGGMGGAWAGAGHFRACGHVARFCQALERGGVSLDPSIFNA
ncbi:MAG: Flp pilus assembly complex ATPase component TadA [Proteobacteria bacterium]|nr:Flp pilus assembly complex ATPase component TadA [Pseudomonadota bacterium]